MKKILIRNICILQFKSLPEEKLFNFTSTTQGGISTGTYTSFNLSPYSGDSPINADLNRKIFAKVANASEENLYIPNQQHTDKVVIIDETFLQKTNHQKTTTLSGVDALITNQKNICIGIFTADCVPLLVFDPEHNILAAIHAGWKGTVAKISQKTICTMADHFHCDPKQLRVGIGPCISQKYFEVGDEVVDAFIGAGFDIEKIGSRNLESGKMHIDLQEANRILLMDHGVNPENIELANLCTYSNPEMFFSARRQTIHSGRMLTGGILR